MAKIAPYTFWQAFDNNGDPLSGGLVYTYEAGTSTPKATYTSSDESTANANPVVLDASGRASIWLASGSYKFVLKTSADVELATIDNITGDASNVFGSSVVDVSTNTNVTAVYQNTVINCTAALTLSLLDVDTAEEGFLFSVKNSSAGNVTIDPDASETIDGASTLTLYPSQSCIVVCTGTGWLALYQDVVGLKKDNTFTGSNTFTGTTDFQGIVKVTGKQLQLSKGADVASAASLPILTDGNFFDVTGTTTITSIATSGKVGTEITLQFDGALILTHHATDLILPSGANITTAAGDVARFVEYASGDWVCVNYERKSGLPLVSNPILHVRRVETSGTVGGTATTGSLQTLTLNTTVKNTITGASLSANAAVLPVGKYRAAGSSGFYRTDGGYIELYNSTAAATIIQGANFFSNSTDGDLVRAYVECEFEITAQSNILLRYRVATGGNTSNLGTAKSFSGISEVYHELIIEKLA